MPPLSSQDASERGARREFRTTVVVLLAAVLVAYLPERAQEPLAASLRATVLRPFLALQESLAAARTRSLQASVLQSRIDSLTVVAISRSTLVEENRRLRGLLALSARVGPGWKPVQILRSGTTNSLGSLIVDAGTRDGVARRAPLITREGLAGVIRESYPDQAVGMDWGHPDFSASAMTLDGLHYGLVESRPGRFQEASRLLLTGVPFNARIPSGAVVVTSGLGAAFPRGIPVGRIREVEDSVGRWQKSYWLEPFVEVGSVTHALVALQDTAGLPDTMGLQDTTVLRDTVGVPGTPGPPETVGVRDISSAWSETEYLREVERADRLRTLEDSVRILRDSLRALQPPDSLPAGAGGGR